MKTICTTIIVLFLFVQFSSNTVARNVMTWIPVYGTATTKGMMNNATKSEWFKNGLTHIGLQFWAPGDNGDVVFVTDYQYTYKAATIGQDVQDFVYWGNANDVKIMLCLHNIRAADFDWTYTKMVIDDYPNETVASIMTIINTYNLDGVDIDFEGIGSYAADKNAFVSFLDTLGRALRASNKELSVDMFSTPCYNYPNPSWASAMAPHVDFMTNMGYSDLYEDNNTLFSYCPATPSESNSYAFKFSYIENYFTNTQGAPSYKNHFGIPSWETDWGGKSFPEHLLDIVDISAAGGISIWDLQLESGGLWLEEDTWNIIAMFKNDSTSAQIIAHSTTLTDAYKLNENKPSSPFTYNPTLQSIQLNDQSGNLYLYSAIGSLKSSWSLKANESISLNTLTTGIYLINFESVNGVYSEKIIIK